MRIAEYGVEIWSAGAADLFVASFDDAFALIDRHPDIGRERGEIGPDARSWLHRGYIVYYEQGGTVFEVRRILHAAADPLIDEDD